ncbi:MAG TPA: hypothetical protein VNS34_13590 [Rhizobiaceae bacterium]|nr:hypothetical protein [Rhizobiaceae bacterium]
MMAGARPRLLMLLLLLTIPVRLWAAEPVVRAQIVTPGSYVPGQQIMIQVDVLAPNFFLSPPQFPLFDLPNAIVTLSDARAQNLTEKIDGETYAGIRRNYLVTAQVAGSFVLPPAEITFNYAAVPGQSTTGSATLPPLTFTVAPAEGAAAGSAAATGIEVAQALDQDPATLKAGDMLVRTITVSAHGLQAMMIPAPTFTAPEGVRIYRHDPKLSDDSSDGLSLGKRVDKVTYGFNKPGTYALPAVEVSWYDPIAKKNDVATAPVVTAVVAESAAFQPAIAPPVQAERRGVALGDWAPYALLGAGLLVIMVLAGWLAARLWPGFVAWRTARRNEREHSEAAFFGRFERACRQGDPLSAYSALDVWSRRAGIAPVAAWLQDAGDWPAQQEFKRFQKATFAPGQGGSAPDLRALQAAIARVRAAWLKRKPPRTARLPALPELNP